MPTEFPQYYIAFKKLSHAILFNCEIAGQLSDGYWENARPHNHWHWLRDLDAYVHAPDMQEPFKFKGTRRISRRYDFAAMALINVVGNRMLAYVRFGTVYGYEHAGLGESVQEIESIIRYAADEAVRANPGTYWAGVLRTIRTVIGVDDTSADALRAGAAQAISKMNAVQYTIKDLRKDLKEMSELVNNYTYNS